MSITTNRSICCLLFLDWVYLNLLRMPWLPPWLEMNFAFKHSTFRTWLGSFALFSIVNNLNEQICERECRLMLRMTRKCEYECKLSHWSMSSVGTHLHKIRLAQSNLLDSVLNGTIRWNYLLFLRKEFWSPVDSKPHKNPLLMEHYLEKKTYSACNNYHWKLRRKNFYWRWEWCKQCKHIVTMREEQLIEYESDNWLCDSNWADAIVDNQTKWTER